MTADMGIIPSRPPPKSSPKQHRHRGTRVPKAHVEDEDDDEGEEDDGQSVVSAISEVSVRTLNTRNLIRATSFSPQTGNPYADYPIRSTPTTQTSRSTTRTVHLDVKSNRYQSQRLRPPPSGPNGRYDDSPGQEYSRSPSDGRVHRANAERPPPSGSVLRETASRDHRQSPTSSGAYSPADNTRNDKQRLRMPNVEDFTVPSANIILQYRETSPIEQRTALPAGYNRPSNTMSAADYASTRVESPSLKPGKPPRTSRGPYSEREVENRRRGDRVSAASASQLNTRQSYQATSPRDEASSPPYPCPPSPASQKYGSSPTVQRPDPYLATVANATEENPYKRNSVFTSPRNIPMPPRPNRLEVLGQRYQFGVSPTTPNSVRLPLSPLGRRPVRTHEDDLEDRRGSHLSPNSAYDQHDYFTSRSPVSQESTSLLPKRRPTADYNDPNDETFIGPVDGPIKERERQPRPPASPSYKNSRTQIRPSRSRKPSGTSTSLLSQRQGSNTSIPRPGSSTSARVDEVDERLESLRGKREAMRKAREATLNDWRTGMINRMPTKRRAMQEELRTDFKDSADLHRSLRDFGWGIETAVEKNEKPIADLSLAFTDAYNKRVDEIYEKYRTQEIVGLPSEDVDVVTSTTFRKGKSGWNGLTEAPGCRVTTDFTLTFAGDRNNEPVTRQSRQQYDDLRTSVPPPQIFAPGIEIPKSSRREYWDGSRDDYDDQRGKRNETRSGPKYDRKGRSNDIVPYDSKYPDRENEERSVASSSGRGRRNYEEVPRQGELLLVPGESHRRGKSKTTKYKYDTSRGPSEAGSREPSKEPPRRESEVPSRASSKAPLSVHSRVSSRVNTKRTKSEERQRRNKEREERGSRQ